MKIEKKRNYCQAKNLNLPIQLENCEMKRHEPSETNQTKTKRENGMEEERERESGK